MYSNIIIFIVQASRTSTAAKMGACLGQETAHKASLDSFLGNHDEVKFVTVGSKLMCMCFRPSGS